MEIRLALNLNLLDYLPLPPCAGVMCHYDQIFIFLSRLKMSTYRLGSPELEN